MAYSCARVVERRDLEEDHDRHAKILEHYAELIDQGIKHYEVRSESLDGIDAIHLVSAETGEDLATYEVLRTLRFTRDEDSKVMSLAQTTPE